MLQGDEITMLLPYSFLISNNRPSESLRSIFDRCFHLCDGVRNNAGGVTISVFTGSCGIEDCDGVVPACCTTFWFVLGFAMLLILFGPLKAFGIASLVVLSCFFCQQAQDRRRGSLHNDESGDVETPTIPSLEEPVGRAELSVLVLRQILIDDPIVDETCEICLEALLVGEEVASSQNLACIHVFHRVCIVEALKRQTTCPCCRRDYLHSDLVIAAAGDTSSRDAPNQHNGSTVPQ